MMVKTIPKRNTKRQNEEALQIAEKRRETKGKGEKERYIHLNAEFQRIARRDKKAFLGDHWKEIEGNNRMERTGTQVHPWLIHVNVWQNRYSIVKQKK